MSSQNCVESWGRLSAHAVLGKLLREYLWLVIQYINLCLEIRRERKVLSLMTDAELQDIGVVRAQVDAESRRSFYDVPAERLGGLTLSEETASRLGLSSKHHE